MSATDTTMPTRCAELIVVRHGESTANAAFTAGRTDRLDGHDADVPLTALGERQSAALGEVFAGWPEDRRPEVVLCSPYLRARRTYEIASVAARGRGVTLPTAHVDDRLPDRGMGDLELMPFAAIRAAHPAEMAKLDADGVYHYRPPGGESLADVADRLTLLLADINHEYAGRRVLLVAHDAIVAVLHYLLDRPSLQDFTDHLAENPAQNASITRWDDSRGKLRMVEYNEVGHVPVAR